MDQELVAYLDRISQQIEGFRGEVSQQIEGLRGEVSQQIEGFRGEMSQKMDDLREELRGEIRLAHVSVEGVRSDLQLLAEALMDTREQFRRHESDVERKLDEIKAMIAAPYRDLNTRVTFLEQRAERQERDAMEVIREKFGKRQG